MLGLPWLVVAVSLAAPQQGAGERERAFGIALRADRSPWASATVRIVSIPFHGCAERDAIEVPADARGEFRAELLTGRAYTAWACSPDGDEWRVSRRLDDVVPRVPIVLEEHAREPRVAVRLGGLGPWLEPGPVAMWLSGFAGGREALALPAEEDAEVPLPPMGTGRRSLFFSAGNGLDLFRHHLPRDARGTIPLVIPPPHEVAVIVLTPEGAPIPGARLRIRSQLEAVLPQRTDERGHATIVVPRPDPSRRDLPVWAEADGHLTSRLWRGSADPAGPWRIFLQPGAASTALLEWRQGEPISSAPVWISGVEQSIEPGATARGRPNSQFATDGHRRTGPRGELTVPYDPSYPLSIGVLLPPAGLGVLRRRLGPALSPLALLHAEVPAAPALRARVDGLRPVRLVFRHHDRSPAPRAKVRIGGGPSPGRGLDYVADQSASITVLLPRIDDVMVAAWHGVAGDVVRLAVPDAAPNAHPTEVLVELPPAVQVGGTVVSEAGTGLDGVKVTLVATLRARRLSWQELSAAPAGDRPRLTARGYYYPPMAMPMFEREARTDARGRFAFSLPSLDFPLAFRVEDQGRTVDIPLVDVAGEDDATADLTLVFRSGRGPLPFEPATLYLYAIAALDGPASGITSKRENPTSLHQVRKSAPV